MLDTPIEVKKAYKAGTHRKNYRFVVLNDDGTEDFTIDNDTLVAESVHIDERMATGSELKFGLCEGSSLEFQYFDHPNINGRTVQAFIDIYYDDVHTHSTPMGYFTVKECPRQFSTGIFKATAYNKLQSEYLDQKANLILEENVIDDSIPITLYSIRDTLLKQFAIDPYEYVTKQSSHFNEQTRTYVTESVKLSALNDNGPISYYEMVDKARQQGITLTTDTTLRITIQSTTALWSFDRIGTHYYRFIENGYDFGRLEELFVTYIENLFDACSLTKTGAQIINEIKSNGESIYSAVGWQRLFGIFILFNSTTTKSYNDYAYKYQNDGTYRVTGSLSDFLKQLLVSSDFDPAHETILYSVPKYISVLAPDPQLSGHYIEIDSFEIVGTGNIEYIGQNGQTKTYNKFTYEDGKSIPSVSDDTFSEWFGFYKVNGLSPADLIEFTPSDMPEFTLRDITSASYETLCQYGQLDRETDLFSGVELNGGGLYPAETLYPANSLYPNSNTGGQGIHPYPSEYSQLWTDTMGEQSFRYLIITYKTLDENNNEVDAVLQRTVNADGTTDYNMSDNWLFRNLVWTAADVGDYADAMVLKMQNIRWFPFEMWAAGLPYVETGDAIEITDREGKTHNSYILQRQLQGIQNLQDTYVNGELDIF